jgi:hypothetical protein
MSKVNLSIEQLLGFIILGINNGNYEAVKNLAQEFLDGMKDSASSEIENDDSG